MKLEFKEDGGQWSVAVTSPTGETTWIPTGETTLEAAKSRAICAGVDKIEEQAKNKMLYRAAFNAAFFGKAARNGKLTVQTAFDEWKEHYVFGKINLVVCHNTICVVARWIREYKVADIHPLDISIEDVNHYINYENNMLMYSTRRYRAKIMKLFIKWLEWKGYCLPNLHKMIRVEPNAVPHSLRHGREPLAYTEDEFKAIKEKFPNGFIRDACIIAWHTGLSLVDIVTLEWDNIDLNRRTLIKYRHKTGMKIEINDLHEDVIEVVKKRVHLKNNPAYSRFIFPFQRDDHLRRTTNAGSACHGLRWYCKKFGIPRKGFHAFRRAYAKRRVRDALEERLRQIRDGALSVVAPELGHSNIRMTEHYAEASDHASLPKPES